MKKKLLLSFAVFATALTVNAQKKNLLRVKDSDNSFKTIEYYTSVERSNFEGVKNNKRGGLLVTDTVGMLQEKYYYASPYRRTKTVQNYFYNNTTDITTANAGKLDTTHLEFTTYTQMVVNNAKFSLKGLRFPYVAINPSAFDVKVYAVRDGKVVKLASKTVIPAKTGAWVTGRVIFDAAVSVVDDTLLYQFEPAEVNTKFVLQVGGVYGKAYESTAATVIKGTSAADTLSVTTWKTEGNYAHSYFFGGQVVKGTDLDAGTIIIKRVGQNKYLIKPQTKVGTTFAVAGDALKYLAEGKSDAYVEYTKFPTVKSNGAIGPDFTKNPEINQSGLYYTQTGVDANQNPVYRMEDTDIDFSPIVEYTLERSANISNKCLATSKTVEITITPNDYSKNPMFNYYAFAAKFLNKKGVDGILYSRIFSTNSLVSGDTIDVDNDVNKYSFTYSGDDKNDTLRMYDRFFAWSKGANSPSVDFLISSKVSTTTSSSKAVYAQLNGKANAAVLGGYAPYTYVWSNKATTASINVGKGDYSVVATDANGCAASSASVTVSEYALSIADLSVSGLSIYPNPTANELNVKFNANSAATIDLVNVAGQVIDTKNANQFANVTFNTSDLNAGVYFINIKVAEGTFSHKIIKE